MRVMGTGTHAENGLQGPWQGGRVTQKSSDSETQALRGSLKHWNGLQLTGSAGGRGHAGAYIMAYMRAGTTLSRLLELR